MSLLEVLTVLAIISAMAILGARTADGFFRSTGRRAAIGQVLGLLEQARMKALASGRPVYVAFADATCPEEQRWRALALFEEGEDPAAPLTAISPWVRLSGRMTFATGLATPSITDAPEAVDSRLFALSGGGERSLPYLKFNPAGGIDYPVQAEAAHLYIGWRNEGEPSTGRELETIRVALFTGRALFLAGHGAPDTTTTALAGRGSR